MGQLHPGYAPLFMNEIYDSTQHLDMPIGPDAEVLRADASLGENGSCLSHYQPGATDCTAAEMNEMPVVRVAVAARILAHRRDEHPIGKRQVSNRERIKQASHVHSLLVICHFSVIRMRRMSKVQTRAGAAATARLGYFLRRLSL